MTDDLFAHDSPLADQQLRLGPQALLLRGWALPWVERIWPAVGTVLAQAPAQRLHTPGGQRMSAALSNCGALGWVSDAQGYRYSARQPANAQPWPAMPPALLELACAAAQAAGFEAFAPDSCLINRYAPGARMGLHQDRDERDLGSPIVSISLGLPAHFLWGGLQRAERPRRVPLFHGDVLVWGGVDRLRFHGVAPVAAGWHPLTGAARFNLSLRRAG